MRGVFWDTDSIIFFYRSHFYALSHPTWRLSVSSGWKWGGELYIILLLHRSMFLTLHSQNPVLMFKRFYFSVWSGTAPPPQHTLFCMLDINTALRGEILLYIHWYLNVRRERVQRGSLGRKKGPHLRISFSHFGCVVLTWSEKQVPWSWDFHEPSNTGASMLIQELALGTEKMDTLNKNTLERDLSF